MKSATGWGIDGGRDLSRQHDLLAFDVGMCRQGGRKQGLGIGV
jgi:hypothetical protein